MFQINCWYNKVNGDQNKVEHTAIRCSNCRRGYGLSMDNMNNKYKDIISLFVFNIVWHHVSISWIIERKTYGIWYVQT